MYLIRASVENNLNSNLRLTQAYDGMSYIISLIRTNSQKFCKLPCMFSYPQVTLYILLSTGNPVYSLIRRLDLYKVFYVNSILFVQPQIHFPFLFLIILATFLFISLLFLAFNSILLTHYSFLALQLLLLSLLLIYNFLYLNFSFSLDFVIYLYLCKLYFLSLYLFTINYLFYITVIKIYLYVFVYL